MSQTRASSGTTARTMQGTTTRIQSGPGEDGVVRCLHNEPAVRLQTTSTKNGNQGRWFYKCNNQQDPCKFFKFEDELVPGSSPQRSSQASSRAGPSTPTAPSRFTPSTGPGTGRRLGSPPPAQASPSKRRAGDDDVMDVSSEEEDGGTAGPSPVKKFKFAAGGRVETPRRNAWQGIRDDAESPFHAIASNLQATASPASSSTAASLSTPSRPAEGSSAADLRTAVDIISQLPEHVARLERKLVAAERSSTHKAKRIAELEEEVKQLKVELLDRMRRGDVLEDTIAALRATG